MNQVQKIWIKDHKEHEVRYLNEEMIMCVNQIHKYCYNRQYIYI